MNLFTCLREASAGNNFINSFSIVTSPLNQRIEAYWSNLSRDRPGWWHRLFQDMVDLELYNSSNPIIVDCLRFCFMHIIRKELFSVANEWNQHLISKSRNSGPSGRPDSMFFLPHLFDAEDHLQDVDLDEVEEFYQSVTDMPRDFSEEFQEFAETVMSTHSISMSTDADSGLKLYMFLLDQIALYSP